MNRTAANGTAADSTHAKTAHSLPAGTVGTPATIETRKISGIVGTRGTMKIKTAAGLRFFTVLITLLLLFGAGTAAAAEPTTQISPSVILTFDSVPDGILTGGNIGINADAEITESLISLIKTQQADANVTNIAYAVAITPKGFDKANVTNTSVTLPTTKTWKEAQPYVYVIAVTDNTTEIKDAAAFGTLDSPLYQTEFVGLPDMVVLIGAQNNIFEEVTPTETETTPTSTGTATATETETPASPAPLLGLFAALGAAIIIKARRG